MASTRGVCCHWTREGRLSTRGGESSPPVRSPHKAALSRPVFAVAFPPPACSDGARNRRFVFFSGEGEGKSLRLVRWGADIPPFSLIPGPTSVEEEVARGGRQRCRHSGLSEGPNRIWAKRRVPRFLLLGLRVNGPIQGYRSPQRREGGAVLIGRGGGEEEGGADRPAIRSGEGRMAGTTACFVIVSRNDIPIYEAELGSSAVRVSVSLSLATARCFNLSSTFFSCVIFGRPGCRWLGWQKEDAAHQHQFILHAALDIVQDVAWNTSAMCVRIALGFLSFLNDLVSAYLVPDRGRFYYAPVSPKFCDLRFDELSL